jgi:hypothetical protein
MGGESSINVTFPRTLEALGISVAELQESDTPFFGIVLAEGGYPQPHFLTRYIRHSKQLPHRIPAFRSDSVRLRLQCHHRKT